MKPNTPEDPEDGVEVIGVIKVNPNTFTLNFKLKPDSSIQQRTAFNNLKQRISLKSARQIDLTDILTVTVCI